MAGLLLISGCAPSFKTFKAAQPAQRGFFQHRVSASGNALLDIHQPALDTLLYVRKLNGGLGAQVTGTDQFVIVPSFNKRLYFLNPNSGAEITSLTTTSAVGSAVAIAGDLIYYAEESGGDVVVCHNLVNGKLVWRRTILDPHGSPIVDGDDLFMVSRFGKVYRLDRFTGKVHWEFDAKSQIYATVAADSTAVFFGDAAGEIVALERNSGQRRWSYATEAAIFAQPMVEDYLFAGSGDGKLHCLDKTTGAVRWITATQAAIHTTPARKDHLIVFGSDDRVVYAVNVEDGGVVWRFVTSGIIQSSPVIVGSSIIVANSAGSVYILSLDGALQREFSVRGMVTAPPAVIEDRLFVVTSQRRLYCFGAR